MTNEEIRKYIKDSIKESKRAIEFNDIMNDIRETFKYSEDYNERIEAANVLIYLEKLAKKRDARDIEREIEEIKYYVMGGGR